MFVKQQAERINFKPFGQAIKSTREKKGLTRKELAAQIRISPRYIASIENSGQTPSLYVFYRFVTCLDTMRRRGEELSKLFKRLYEDNVLGRVTDEQYRMLAGDYTVEQKALEEQIPEKEARLEKLKAASANVNTFVEKAKQYTAIDELTPELLRLFIQRIEVGERTEKYSRSSHQSIRIVYRDIGTVDSAMEQGEAQPRIAPPLSEVFELPA